MAGAADASELGATAAERRAGFERWAAAHLDEYEHGRDRGRVDLDAQGLALVKLFALGRGTFATHERAGSPGEGVVRIEARLRFGYAHIDLSHFSPGTTFYVSGAPVGRVYPFRVPAGSGEVTLEVLDRVTVVWTLVRREASETCPAGWAVASGEPVAGSETTVEVTWAF